MRFSRFYYLYCLVFIFAIPALALGYLIYPLIDKQNLLIFMIGITIIGSLWDVWATRHGKRDPVWLWQFNKKDTLGLTFLGLPIEEYLFYLVTSGYIIFTWESLRLVQELPVMQTILPCVAVWTLFFIGLPYAVGYKNKDKF